MSGPRSAMTPIGTHWAKLMANGKLAVRPYYEQPRAAKLVNFAHLAKARLLGRQNAALDFKLLAASAAAEMGPFRVLLGRNAGASVDAAFQLLPVEGGVLSFEGYPPVCCAPAAARCAKFHWCQNIIMSSLDTPSAGSLQRRLLLFWPVDNSKRTVTQVKKNVHYIRSSLGDDCCHVMLAHYKGKPDDWGSQWYKDNVAGSYVGPGFKFKFMRDAYMKAMNVEESWESKYEYVWGLDSDLDLTGTNLTKLLEMARLSNALIVGPTFVGKGVNWVKPSGVRKKGSGKAAKHSPKAHKKHSHPAAKAEKDKVTSQHVGVEPRAQCKLRAPRPHKASSLQEQAHQDYRHTDFVELTAPLLSPAALPIVFNQCTSVAVLRLETGGLGPGPGLDGVIGEWREGTPQGDALSDVSPPIKGGLGGVGLGWGEGGSAYRHIGVFPFHGPSPAYLRIGVFPSTRPRKYWSALKTLSCIVVEPAVKVEKVEVELLTFRQAPQVLKSEDADKPDHTMPLPARHASVPEPPLAPEAAWETSGSSGEAIDAESASEAVPSRWPQHDDRPLPDDEGAAPTQRRTRARWQSKTAAIKLRKVEKAFKQLKSEVTRLRRKVRKRSLSDEGLLLPSEVPAAPSEEAAPSEAPLRPARLPAPSLPAAPEPSERVAGSEAPIQKKKELEEGSFSPRSSETSEQPAPLEDVRGSLVKLNANACASPEGLGSK
ncbi:hypothetical protein AK812_SmicGene40922 [Symbiodinium microadriaticum]|uniref:Uncharacterized protein n=1 Tax=Symbiodinium microadriaticum TaxID=2951 RepID=A0A1Q9C7G4_SYMMI|nr:hypothetical protein AK812_SmicGene40922 [Symbiodinium microadriaticum]